MTTASEGSVEQVIHDNQGFKESDAAERKPKEGDDDDNGKMNWIRNIYFVSGITLNFITAISVIL